MKKKPTGKAIKKRKVMKSRSARPLGASGYVSGVQNSKPETEQATLTETSPITIKGDVHENSQVVICKTNAGEDMQGKNIKWEGYEGEIVGVYEHGIWVFPPAPKTHKQITMIIFSGSLEPNGDVLKQGGTFISDGKPNFSYEYLPEKFDQNKKKLYADRYSSYDSGKEHNYQKAFKDGWQEGVLTTVGIAMTLVAIFCAWVKYG